MGRKPPTTAFAYLLIIMMMKIYNLNKGLEVSFFIPRHRLDQHFLLVACCRHSRDVKTSERKFSPPFVRWILSAAIPLHDLPGPRSVCCFTNLTNRRVSQPSVDMPGHFKRCSHSPSLVYIRMKSFFLLLERRGKSERDHALVCLVIKLNFHKQETFVSTHFSRCATGALDSPPARASAGEITVEMIIYSGRLLGTFSSYNRFEVLSPPATLTEP